MSLETVRTNWPRRSLRKFYLLLLVVPAMMGSGQAQHGGSFLLGFQGGMVVVMLAVAALETGGLALRLIRRR